MKVETLNSNIFEALSDAEAFSVYGGNPIITKTSDGGIVIKTYNSDGTLAEKDYIYVTKDRSGVTIGLHPV